MRTAFWRRFRAAGLGLLLLAGPAAGKPAPGAGQRVWPGPGREPGPSLSENQALIALLCIDRVLSYRTLEAEAVCGKLIAQFPDSPVGYKYRGMAYLLDHRFERAESDFSAAVARDPKDAENQAGYGQALSGQGKFTAAIARFDIALKLSPSEVRFLGARCWARAGQGTALAKGLADCDQAVRLSPDYAVGFDGRGLIFLRQRKFARSVTEYSHSLELRPDRATAYFGRGLAEADLGLTRAAHDDLSFARGIDADIDGTFVMLGVLSPGCRAAEGACELPPELRAAPHPARPFVAVVYRPGQEPASDETVTVIEIGRIDAMLEQSASLLGAGNGGYRSYHSGDLGDAGPHLDRALAEYDRLAAIACGAGKAQGSFCVRRRPLPFGTVLPAKLRETYGRVEPLWKNLCRRLRNVDPPNCQME